MGSLTEGESAPLARMYQHWCAQRWTLWDVAARMRDLGIPVVAAPPAAREPGMDPLSALLPDRVCRPSALQPHSEDWAASAEAGHPLDVDDWIEVIAELTGGDVAVSDAAERAARRIRTGTSLALRERSVARVNTALEVAGSAERVFVTLDYEPLLIVAPGDPFRVAAEAFAVPVLGCASWEALAAREPRWFAWWSS